MARGSYVFRTEMRTPVYSRISQPVQNLCLEKLRFEDFTCTQMASAYKVVAGMRPNSPLDESIPSKNQQPIDTPNRGNPG